MLNSQIESDTTILRWAATDADGDALTCYVYLGTNTNPTEKIAENLTESNFNVAGLLEASSIFFYLYFIDVTLYADKPQ